MDHGKNGQYLLITRTCITNVRGLGNELVVRVGQFKQTLGIVNAGNGRGGVQGKHLGLGKPVRARSPWNPNVERDWYTAFCGLHWFGKKTGILDMQLLLQLFHSICFHLRIGILKRSQRANPGKKATTGIGSESLAIFSSTARTTQS